MSFGKKRSGFQITSVTSDCSQAAAGQSAPSVVRTVLPSAASSSSSSSSSCRPQGSSSQPTTPSLKRKYISHDAPSGQGGACSSRFRVVRLAAGGDGSSGWGEPYRRGRWTCTDVMERQEGPGFRRVMDTMRHAHSLESLEMIGRDTDRGGAHGNTRPLAQPIRGMERAGLILRSGPPSPTHPKPINIRFIDIKEPMGAQGFDSTSPLPPPRPQNVPRPLRLDVDAVGGSVLRLSHSQPSSPPAGSYHPILTPAALNLDRTIFSLSEGVSGSGNSLTAIDNKIEQAMDLVKSHLLMAVREEVELLREQIRELQEKNHQLERENHILKTLTNKQHTA